MAPKQKTATMARRIKKLECQMEYLFQWFLADTMKDRKPKKKSISKQ